MSAMRKVLVVENQEPVGKSFQEVLRVVPPVAPAATAAAAQRQFSLPKNMALFLVSPFVGLVYAVLLPFVGVAMLAWVAGKALYGHPKFRKALRFGGFAAKIATAPLVGLAYLVLFPFVGAAMLVWVGAKEVAGSSYTARALAH